MRPVFIYALLDPRTDETRYVGQTLNPDKRLREHIRDAKKKQQYNSRWIRTLLTEKLKPVMEILDVFPDSEVDFWEREYIQNYRERGFKLTNFSDGGNAAFRGKKMSPEHRAKISASLTGKPKSKEHVAAVALALTGRKQSPEKSARHSAKMRGRKQSSEVVTNRTAKITGLKRTPEQRAAMSVSHRGIRHSAVSIEKNRIAHLGKKHSELSRANMAAAQKLRRAEEKAQRLVCA